MHAQNLSRPPSGTALQESVNVLLLGAMVGLAAITSLTHLAQGIGLSFRLYAFAATAIGVAVAAGTAFEAARGLRKAWSVGRTVTLALGLTTLSAALLALMCHRPSSDDAYYLPNVVYALAHPDEAMGHVIHFVAGMPEPIVSFYQGTSFPFEYAQGALAYVTGVPLMALYHKIVPLVLGTLVPLAWFYLVSRFDVSAGAAVVGAMLVCVSLTWMGESHRTFGNYAFNRLWQGKAVLLTIGLPTFVAMSLDYFRWPGWRSWIGVAACATALSGMSTTSIVLLPILAAALFFSWVIVRGFSPTSAMDRVTWKLAAAYFLSTAYVVGFGLLFLVLSAGDLQRGTSINQNFPQTYSGQIQLVFGNGISTTAILLAVSVVVCLLLLNGWQRLFVAAWLVCVAAVVLNPVIADVLMEYVAPPNIYWRLSYLLPFPLCIGLSGAALFDRFGGSRIWLIGLLAIAILSGFAHTIPGTSSIFQNGTRVGLGYQLKHRRLAHALEIVETAPRGTMMAPWPIGNLVILASGHHAQMAVRPDGLALWFPASEAEARLAASDFLATGAGGRHGLVTLIDLVAESADVRSVVVRSAVARRYDVEEALAKLGFGPGRAVRHMTVFSREDDDVER